MGKFKHYVGEEINGSVIVSIDNQNKTYTLRCISCSETRIVTFVTVYNVLRSKVSCSRCRLGRWGVAGDATQAHFSRLRTMAKQRGKVWTLTFEEFFEVIGDRCFYCGSLGTERTSWDGNSKTILCGIDRVDSSKDYSVDNIVPCCGICNRAKHTMSQQEFLLWIDNLVKFKENNE